MNSIIKKAAMLIESNGRVGINKPEFLSIYMFTTENIRGITRAVDVTNKTVLTVSSSGDHIFNMLLNGAKVVESYDINYFTKYYFYFKEAAIRILSYDEFLDFFFTKKFHFNTSTFNDEVFFNRILPNIKSKEAKVFWQTLFNWYGGRIIYHSYLFFENNHQKNTYIMYNDYLNCEDNYNSLKQKLSSYIYKFYWANIFDNIKSFPNKKYDIIYLSNILDRLYCEDESTYIRYIHDIVDKLSEHLTDDGLLGMCYLYCYLDEYWSISTPSQITNPDIRFKYFNHQNFSYISFNGATDPKSSLSKNKDALMLMLKKKN